MPLSGVNKRAQSNDGDQCFEHVKSLYGEYLYTNGLGFFIINEGKVIYATNVNWSFCSAIMARQKETLKRYLVQADHKFNLTR